MSFDALIAEQLAPILDRLSNLETAAGDGRARQAEVIKQIASALGSIQDRVKQVDGLEAARAALDAKLARVASELTAMQTSIAAQGSINRKFGETLDIYGVQLRDIGNAMSDPAPIAASAPFVAPVSDELSDLLRKLTASMGATPAVSPLVPAPIVAASGLRACSGCGVVPRELSRGLCPGCAWKGVR